MKPTIKVTDYSKLTDRISITTEDGLTLWLIKTPEGYVLDVYSKEDNLIFTGTIWEDDYKE